MGVGLQAHNQEEARGDNLCSVDLCKRKSLIG